jgi:poly(A) polymerase
MDSVRGEPAPGQARVVPRAEHTISRKDLDPDALKVLYRLYRSRYAGYLVGGGVRDLLIGREPKDFDIGTDATPQEIRHLFRNSRIIGRRFPLVHVYFRGGKVVEVSTFRKNAPDSQDGDRIVRDDNWGTPEEDAWRRDLTINGLFYDIETFSVIDYVGGLEDLEKGIIRTIGDPFDRFREDPVRMIRAIRHAARTGFEIEPRTWQAIEELHELIHTCAAPRVLEEFLRELRGGVAKASLELMARSGLLGELVPDLDDYIADVEEADDAEARLFWSRVEALDRARHANDQVANAVSLSVVLSGIVTEDVQDAEERANGARRPDIGKVVRDALVPILVDLGISRRDLERCFHISLAGRKLRKAVESGRIPHAFQRKSYFDESWAFMRIMLEGEGWSTEAIDALTQTTDEPRPRSRGRRRRRRPRRGDGDGDA